MAAAVSSETPALPAHNVEATVTPTMGLRSPIESGIRLWSEKRGSRSMPALRDFEGEDFEPLRPNAIFMDVGYEPLDFKYRTVGATIVSRNERDYSGIRMRDVAHQAPPSKVWSSLLRVTEEKTPLFSDVPYVGPDQAVTVYRDVMLPLSDDGHTVNSVLVLIEFESRPYTVSLSSNRPEALREEAPIPPREDRGVDGIVGESPAVRQLRQRLTQLLSAERSLADRQAPPILIFGETGTGKNLAARVLHYDGVRNGGPFIEVNFSSIPSHLLEAELFGYEPGTFPDSPEGKKGLVEAADGGTLFLDEVSELDLSAQARILRLLEHKSLRRLGGARNRAMDVRIIAATDQCLDEMVQQGAFRADLCYRLKGVVLDLPPLRERGEDIVLLAEHFLAHHGRRYRKPELKFDQSAIAAIASHHWPGNVRELSNAIEQAVVMASEDSVGRELLPIRPPAERQAPKPFEDASTIIVSAYSGDRIQMDDVERGLIVKALERCHGNVSQAARTLGISRDQLRYRIAKYGLE